WRMSVLWRKRCGKASGFGSRPDVSVAQGQSAVRAADRCFGSFASFRRTAESELSGALSRSRGPTLPLKLRTRQPSRRRRIVGHRDRHIAHEVRELARSLEVEGDRLVLVARFVIV